jgi:diaminohydroxyphosphoribosylaminopyrimidine deaminase/5-amino-6-(5-phosphoribosylamino)uracil reductase
MALALRLAHKGLYSTHPNPRVGCVIAREQRIIGRGWHQYTGGPHAEIAALNDADGSVDGATAYVTLEPCSHHGRTSPCTDALAQSGVTRVVIATVDPNPRVSGRGIRWLQDAGMEVETGLMGPAAEELNAGFMLRMRQGRPWIRVKIAQSLDGRTALANGESQWISSETSRRDVQRWRARSSAIMTGIGTVLADDPSMNARRESLRSQPLRVIADSRWRTPANSRILGVEGPVLVAGSESHPIPRGLQETEAGLISLPEREGHIDLQQLMHALAAREINEVQVEAGPRLCGALLAEQLVDEVLIYQAPVLLGEGAAGSFAFGPLESMAQRAHLRILETRHIGGDLRIRLQAETRT